MIETTKYRGQPHNYYSVVAHGNMIETTMCRGQPRNWYNGIAKGNMIEPDGAEVSLATVTMV